MRPALALGVLVAAGCVSPPPPRPMNVAPLVMPRGYAEVPWERLAARILDDRRSVFLDCYEQEVRRVEERAVEGDYRSAKAPPMAGRLVLVMPVEADGVVRAPRLEDDVLQNENVGRCLLERARETLFAAPPRREPVELTLPLAFKLVGPAGP